MKKYIIPSIGFFIGLSLIVGGLVANKKPVNENENRCPYEGLECPNAQHYLRDYQIDLHIDTVWLYDGDRLVGRFINSTPNSKLDSLISEDNL